MRNSTYAFVVVALLRHLAVVPSCWLLSFEFVDAVRVLPNDHQQRRQQQERRRQKEESTSSSSTSPGVEEVVSSIISDQQQRQRRLGRNTKKNAVGVVEEVPNPTLPDEHLVTNLPLLPEGSFPTKHWAGLLPASSDGDKYFFYWLFEPDFSLTTGSPTQKVSSSTKDIPLLIWINGGPGCSSMDGLFLENGPFRFVVQEEEDASSSGKYVLKPAKYSWHKAPAYTLYIDQPVGTGLSYTTDSTKYPKNDEEVNIDFYYFLQSFFSLHSDKFVNNEEDKSARVNRPFYFSGESHAGHFIPSLMSYILHQNEQIIKTTTTAADGDNNNNNKIYIPLTGAAIGNGWIDPFHQYAAAEAAYGSGLIGRAQKNALDLKEKECQKQLNNKNYVASVCFALLDTIVDSSFGTNSMYKISTYDKRDMEPKNGARTFPPGHKIVEKYLGFIGPHVPGITKQTMTDALAAIHATPSRTAGQVYEECTNPPYDALSWADGLGVVPDVVRILEYTPPTNDDEEDGEEADTTEQEKEKKIKLLFFNGVEDMICNHIGNEILLEKLPWNKREEYINAGRFAWKSNLAEEVDDDDDDNNNEKAGEISGYMKQYDNLMFLKVLNSGHMVPMDVPDIALDMIRTFMFGGENGGGFQHNPQKLRRSLEPKNEECVCPMDALEAFNDQEKKQENGQNDEGDGRL